MRLFQAWNRFWFDPAPAVNLSVCRMTFFLGLLMFYLPEDFAAWGVVGPAFWMPMPVFATLRLVPFSEGTIDVLTTIWRLSLILSAVGLFTRASMITAAVLGFYLLALPHNFGHVYHFDALLVLAMIIMACSRAGDAWSVDAAIRPRAHGPSPEYTWPIRMIWVLMALVFFAAGVAKLRYGGAAWVTSPNMSLVLMRSAYHTSDADPVTSLGLWVAGHLWLSRALAAFALVTELGFIGALISRRTRRVLVPAAALMLVGIRIMMGPTFGGFLIANVFWVDWSGVGARLGRWCGRLRDLAVLPGAGQVGTATATMIFRESDRSEIRPVDSEHDHATLRSGETVNLTRFLLDRAGMTHLRGGEEPSQTEPQNHALIVRNLEN